MVKLDSKMFFFFFEMFCIQEGEAFRTRYQKKKKKNGVTRLTSPLSTAEAVNC